MAGPVNRTGRMRAMAGRDTMHTNGTRAETEPRRRGRRRAGLGAVTPTRDEFRALAADRRVIPVVRRLLADDETPLGVYRKLAGSRPNTFLFESAENGQSWSR